MAITNAQQYQQLVNPPMKGKKRPGYRGDAAAASGAPGMAGPGPGSDPGEGQATGGDRGDRREQRSVAQTLGVSPTTQSALDIDRSRTKTIDRLNRIADIEKFINRPPVGFTDAAKVNLLSPSSLAKTAFGALIGIPGFGFLNNINVSGNPAPQGTGGGGRDADQGIPYWAQLGFSSEEEYLASLRAQAPSTTEQEPEEPQGLEGLRLAFRAEGGRIGAQEGDNVVGGEFDFESARQMYGLGKLVKKIGRTVKKVAKSPIGKAALLYAGGTYLGGLKAFGGTGFGSGNFLANLRSGQGISNLFNFGKAKFLSKPLNTNLLSNLPSTTVDRLATQAAKTAMGASSTGSGLGIGAAITAVSLLPLLGLGTGDESEEEAQAILDQSGLDLDAIRANPNEYLATAFKAEGGSIKEPVAKKTMPLLDMGGQEMDLRAEGGFVPIGRMEKADDVPARLSKNEFVFTAEAVRNAGEGDVDKGAEVMYNMMKNLEAGGDVSEESQGLKGARKMFQTSQRLEEVL